MNSITVLTKSGGVDVWKMISTRIMTESGKEVETYGISRGSTVVSDVSLCKTDIQEFVELLNRLDASEVHARDLVEDFLGKG